MRSVSIGLVVTLAALLFTAPLRSAELDAVRTALVQDIQQAQRALGAAEADISGARGDLARRINAVQNRVLELRERAVAARRLADEETLSLEQIETRLEAWREQSQFQGRLLAGFLERNGRRDAVTRREADLQQDLRVFLSYLGEQSARLYPAWQPTELVMPGGQIVSAQLLSLGPVQWYWQPDADQGGLAQREQSLVRAVLPFTGAAQTGLRALHQTAAGSLTFDPTLSRVLQLAGTEENLFEHVRKGGIWVIPILLFALFATVIAAYKALWLYRLPTLVPALAERTQDKLAADDDGLQRFQQQLQGAQAGLLRIALAPQQSTQQRDDRLYAALLEQRNSLERWLGAIAITASVAPLLGLLGTVSGMITTFRQMTLFGAGDASAVSGGISEALVTTELGLVVAIPALVAHALMSRKTKGYLARLEHDAVQLSQLPLQRQGA